MAGRKLHVRYGKSKKYPPFHPTLKIETNSGNCSNQWVAMHFRPGLMLGGGCVSECSVDEAVTEYFSELQRMGYRQVERENGEAK